MTASRLRLAGAVLATEYRAIDLDTVADHLAPTMRTFRRKQVNSALEAVESMRIATAHDLE